MAERRRVVGYTQEQLALSLEVERTTVVRWEAGETTPQPWCRPKLAKALDVSVEELDTMLTNGEMVEDRSSRSSAKAGANGQLCDGVDVDAVEELPDDPQHDAVLVAPWNHLGAVDAVVMLNGGDPVKRRKFVLLTGTALTAPAHQWLINEPGPLVSGLSGRRVSSALADRFMAMIPELRAMDDVVGGGDVLSLSQYHFGWVGSLLHKASYDDATGRKLHSVLAELGQLLGWVCYDTGQHGLAQRYYITALRAAHAADDRALGAHILGSMAYQAVRQGHPAEAVTLIETAVMGTRGKQIPRLLAELHLRQAYAFADLKDSSACITAISQARSQVERAVKDDEPAYLYWVTPAVITTGTGDCLLQLGQADRAVTLINQGIAMFDAPFDRDRQLYLTDLVEALARPGKQCDLESAAAKGIEAIQLAENLSSTRSVDRICYLIQLMKPHAKVPAVREFLEQAWSFIGK